MGHILKVLDFKSHYEKCFAFHKTFNSCSNFVEDEAFLNLWLKDDILKPKIADFQVLKLRITELDLFGCSWFQSIPQIFS